MTPACMTPDELALWQDGARLVRKFGGTSDVPCRDCPLAFALEMRTKGCCNGIPGFVGRPRLEDTRKRIGERRRAMRYRMKRASQAAYGAVG